MRALYEIDQEILDCVDLETGEILDSAKLDALQMERERKLEGVALWVKDLNYEAQMVKEEADKLTARKRALDTSSLANHLESQFLMTPTRRPWGFTFCPIYQYSFLSLSRRPRWSHGSFSSGCGLRYP